MRLAKVYSVIFVVIVAFLGAAFAGEDAVKEDETFFMAQKAYEDGFYEVSLGLLERFTKNYPYSLQLSQANLLEAECYFRQNKLLEALNKFESLLNNKDAQHIKDAVYYGIAEVHFKGNNFSKAAGYYRNIIEEFPNSSYLPQAYYSLGWCLFQEQKFKDALGYFKVLESKFPNEPQAKDAVFKIVESLYNLKDYAALKEKINSSLGLFASDPVQLSYLYFYLGEAQFYTNNFSAAIESYSKVFANNKDKKMLALAKLDLAWSYLKLKRYKESEEAFFSITQDILESRSQDALLLGKAMLMLETNRVNEASDLFKKVIETTKDSSILAQAYIGRAEAFCNLSDYQAAADLYKEAILKIPADELTPELSQKLHYNLGWVFIKQGNYKAAIGELNALSRASEDTALKVSILCQLGDAYLESGEYKKAQDTYVAILRDYPNNSYSDYIQYQLGLVMIKEGDFSNALKSLSGLAAEFPGSKFVDDAAYRIGLAYFEKQDFKSSKDILIKFRTEFKDSPFRRKALFLLGSCFYNLGDFTSAIQNFSDLIKLENQGSELAQKAEYEIADSYYQLGQEKEALSRFKALRTKYPDSVLTPEVIWWLGEYYYQRNNPSLARRYFLSLINDFPKSSLVYDAYYALGLILMEESNTEEAINNFNKALNTNSPETKAKIKNSMAGLYEKTNKPDLAINLYKDIIENYPSFGSQVYPRLAKLLLDSGEYASAIGYYKMAIQDSEVKDLPELYLKMAEANEAQGDLNAAMNNYLKVVDLSEDKSELAVKSLLRIAQIYEDRNKINEALKYYRIIEGLDIPESKFAKEKIGRIKLLSR